MAISVGELLKYGNNTPDLKPALDCSNRLLYYKVGLIELYEEWLEESLILMRNLTLKLGLGCIEKFNLIQL